MNNVFTQQQINDIEVLFEQEQHMITIAQLCAYKLNVLNYVRAVIINDYLDPNELDPLMWQFENFVKEFTKKLTNNF